MKLFHSATSPFVRKVLVTAHETGLFDRLTFETLRPMPTNPDPALSKANPLSKIPALVTDDGVSIVDSPVICEYLDSLHGGRKLVPAEGAARFRVKTHEALADGAVDAGIVVFYERAQRPKELHWQPWLDGHTKKVLQALDFFDSEAPAFGPDPDLGQIALASGLGWLTFRDVVGDWRATRPRLASWFERFGARPSMVATAPKA
ncbi:MAG: glutathione S-transferase N-terminal domain-containing protein [Polyangiaceae bacterium]